MRYFSIDIETSGLDKERDAILEIAAIYDDLNNPKPVYELPYIHRYIDYERLEGDLFALHMNAHTIKQIILHRQRNSDLLCLTPEYACDKLRLWMLRIHPDITSKFNAVGKNFQSFDRLFIDNASTYPINFHYRSLDVGSLYFDPKIDPEVPGLQDCLDRAGIKETVSHSAYSDALQIVKLIRHYYKIGEE